MTGLRTACHACRVQVHELVPDADGVPRSRLIPHTGEGFLVRPVMATVGDAAASEECRMCGGTGWLPGFQPPG